LIGRKPGALIVALSLCGWLVTAPAVAQTVHISHCLQGCPLGAAASNELLVRHLFAVSVNSQTRVADWVSYRIIDGSIGVASLLPRAFKDDDLMDNGFRLNEVAGNSNQVRRPVVTNQLESSYRISETIFSANDQGHLVPMSSFADSGYWPDLNFLSVMSLIKPDMRLGSWARLDQAVNQLVRDSGEVYVLAGPVYSPDLTGLNEVSDISIPTAYFKIIANNQGEFATFLFNQDLATHADYCMQRGDLSEIES
jgi:endonuclease G